MTHRDPFAVTARAMRDALTTALADPGLTFGHLRVLNAIVVDTASWSKLTDRTTRDRLAAVAHVSLNTVKRALRYLHDLGVIVWTPNTTRDGRSRVTLVSAHPEGPQAVVPSAHLDGPVPEENYQLQERDAREHDDGDDVPEQAWAVVRQAGIALGATVDDLPDTAGIRAVDAAVERLLRQGVPELAVWDALTAAAPPPTVWSWPGLLRARLRTVDGREQLRVPSAA